MHLATSGRSRFRSKYFHTSEVPLPGSHDDDDDDDSSDSFGGPKAGIHGGKFLALFTLEAPDAGVHSDESSKASKEFSSRPSSSRPQLIYRAVSIVVGDPRVFLVF